jgi:hypothetical protein
VLQAERDCWPVADAVMLFLKSSAQPLHAWQIACPWCRDAADHLGIADRQPPPKRRLHPFPRRRPRHSPVVLREARARLTGA